MPGQAGLPGIDALKASSTLGNVLLLNPDTPQKILGLPCLPSLPWNTVTSRSLLFLVFINSSNSFLNSSNSFAFSQTCLVPGLWLQETQTLGRAGT
jgi:hypothetical protein